jgi:hypothetical protein
LESLTRSFFEPRKVSKAGLRVLCWNFRTFYGGLETEGYSRVVASARQVTLAGGIDSLESILGLLKNFKNTVSVCYTVEHMDDRSFGPLVGVQCPCNADTSFLILKTPMRLKTMRMELRVISRSTLEGSERCVGGGSESVDV